MMESKMSESDLRTELHMVLHDVAELLEASLPHIPNRLEGNPYLKDRAAVATARAALVMSQSNHWIRPEAEGDWECEVPSGGGHERYHAKWTCNAYMAHDSDPEERHHYPGFLEVEVHMQVDGPEYRVGTAEDGGASVDAHGCFSGRSYGTLEEAQLSLEEEYPLFQRKG